MNRMDYQAWWQLHLRNAKGEQLSEAEQLLYDAELERQENEATPLNLDLQSLKQLRNHMLGLAQANKQLRGRLDELNREIHLVEQSLSKETREALGVEE